jgi:hypothetical protein
MDFILEAILCLLHHLRMQRIKGDKKGHGSHSAIADIMVLGSQVLQEGKFSESLKGTTYNPTLGYPLST